MTSQDKQTELDGLIADLAAAQTDLTALHKAQDAAWGTANEDAATSGVVRGEARVSSLHRRIASTQSDLTSAQRAEWRAELDILCSQLAGIYVWREDIAIPALIAAQQDLPRKTAAYDKAAADSAGAMPALTSAMAPALHTQEEIERVYEQAITSQAAKEKARKDLQQAGDALDLAERNYIVGKHSEIVWERRAHELGRLLGETFDPGPTFAAAVTAPAARIAELRGTKAAAPTPVDAWREAQLAAGATVRP